jgi:hypothetical protein
LPRRTAGHHHYHHHHHHHHHACLQCHATFIATGGIKLHIELSILLGSLASSILQLSSSFYAATWLYLGPAVVTATAAAALLGGAAAGCAAAADALLLLSAPLVLMYCCSCWLQRLQLRSLKATWRLIRGKQKVRPVWAQKSCVLKVVHCRGFEIYCITLLHEASCQLPSALLWMSAAVRL